MTERDPTTGRFPSRPRGHGGPAHGKREPFKPGNVVGQRHGANSPRLVGPLSDELRQDIAEMIQDTPAAAPQFAVAVGALATKLARLQLVSTWLSDNGPLDETGEPRPAVRFELELLASVEKSLDALGLTPTAAARLGVDLVRGESLVEHMDTARRIRAEAETKHRGTGQ